MASPQFRPKGPVHTHRPLFAFRMATSRSAGPVAARREDEFGHSFTKLHPLALSDWRGMSGRRVGPWNMPRALARADAARPKYADGLAEAREPVLAVPPATRPPCSCWERSAFTGCALTTSSYRSRTRDAPDPRRSCARTEERSAEHVVHVTHIRGGWMSQMADSRGVRGLTKRRATVHRTPTGTVTQDTSCGCHGGAPAEAFLQYKQSPNGEATGTGDGQQVNSDSPGKTSTPPTSWTSRVEEGDLALRAMSRSLRCARRGRSMAVRPRPGIRPAD